MMTTVSVEEVECKQAVNRVRGMDFDWSLNPYRGCQHACVYCYARKTHRFLDLSPGRDFERQLLAKVNLAQQLERDLKQQPEIDSLVVGTATDPYQPVEKQYQLTRRCLEVIGRFSVAASITTKAPLVVRDLPQLMAIQERNACSVNISITTLDAGTARWLEPQVAPPVKRLEIIQHLSQAGIPVGMFIAPVLPGITDDPLLLRKLLQAAADAGADFVHASVLRLDPPVKHWYYQRLKEYDPGLIPRYRRFYRGATGAPVGYQSKIKRWFKRQAADLGLQWNRPQPKPKRRRPRQQRLPV